MECPRNLLSVNGLRVYSKLSHAVYNVLRAQKITTNSYHPSENGGVERVNHTMAEMLAMVANELQNNWDERAPSRRVCVSVSAATGLAPNEVHMRRIPRLALRIFGRARVASH